VLTGLAGLAASEATAALLRQRLTPQVAIAEAVIEATPGRLALALIHLVGRWDKPLLAAGVLLGLVLLSAAAGLLTARGPLRAELVLVAVAVLAGVAVMSRPGVTATALLPVLVGATTWLVVLPYLTRSRAVADSTPLADRRAFLRRAGIVAAGSLVLGTAGRYLGRKRRAVEAARAALDLPATGGVVPTGADLGPAPWRTPNPDFYRIDTAVAVPAVLAEGWRLRIHGLVERELTVTYDDLLERELTEAWVTLCCVSNPVGGDLVGNAWWSGVRIADLLAEAGPVDGADAVLQTSEDGWTCGTPLAALTDERDALLALAMNGEPLPVDHGFPVRMVVPGLYGYVSATKWLVDLEVSRFADVDAFWTRRGWAEEGPVRTQSRIDVPRHDQGVRAGVVRVGGVAWAQHTGIEAVEIRLDGGPWTPAELGRVPSADTWVQWSASVEAAPGSHTVAVRATDRSGYTQTAVRRDVVPDGATGWHTVDFVAE
jgi:DMSO/TMAO reductase YedYZ molybdopterin-dependent catalytic subunit